VHYKNHRFPGDIISHGVWLYYRFTLSSRDVQELLFERGITVSHEAIRQWCWKFRQDDANRPQHRRPQPGDKWYLDEVFLTIQGTRHYLWRAVDQDDNVLDILVQRRRNKQAAKKFFRKLLKGGQYVPRVIIIDRRANGNIACKGLNQRGMPSGFCLPTAPLHNIFDRDGICCQRPTIVKRCGNDSRVGPK
jgi:putative transposase